jgi:TolB-like protein
MDRGWLIKAADRSTAWSGVYDREMDDIVAVEQAIARSVTSELKVTLLGGTMAANAAR